MRILSLSPFLSLFMICAIAVAQTTNDITYHASYTCYERRTNIPTRSGNPANCARAMLEAFPTDGNVDPAQLPLLHNVGDCLVSLIVGPGGPVRGRWLDVWTKAQMLSTACTYFRTGLHNIATGGEANFPDQGLQLAIGLALRSNESSVATE